MGYITSKDLSGREGLTGAARKQKENKVRLEKAIEDIIQIYNSIDSLDYTTISKN